MLDKLLFSLRGRKKAEALDADEYHDIVLLWNLRAVDVAARGRSITEIHVDVTNRLDRQIKILIPHGTYFQSKGQHQNMVTRKEHVFVVDSRGTRYVAVQAACINADRPIPAREDQFRGVKRVPPNVERFLRASDGYPPMVVQAGVWALTDRYSRRQIRERLQTQSRTGAVDAAISEGDVDQAKGLLDRLQIPHSLV